MSWPQIELDGLVQKEIAEGKVILPVWHNVTHLDVAHHSLPLADKVAGCTSLGIPALVQELLRAIGPTPSSSSRVAWSAPIDLPAVPPISPANLEHDTATFRKLDHIASEGIVDDLLNGKIYISAYHLNDDHLLTDFVIGLQRIENRYLDPELRKEAEKLLENLDALVNIVRRTFFSVGEGRLKFYPDPIDSTHYDRERIELTIAIDCAWNAYKIYRTAIKERLRA